MMSSAAVHGAIAGLVHEHPLVLTAVHSLWASGMRCMRPGTIWNSAYWQSFEILSLFDLGVVSPGSDI